MLFKFSVSRNRGLNAFKNHEGNHITDSTL